MVLEVHDRLVAPLPEAAVVERLFGQALRVQDLLVHADDQHFLVVGPVEDPDASTFGQTARGTPQEVVIEIFGARVLETEHLASLRIHA
jgi:hypothetical protein